MKKLLVLFIFSIIIFNLPAYSISFKIGGLFGTADSYKNGYNNAPVGYVEHKFYGGSGWDVRASIGFSYLEKTVFENTVLYGYADTVYKITGLNPVQNATDTYAVSGPLNGERNLYLVPLVFQVFKYFKPSPKSPEFSVFGGANFLYYSEDYKQFTDSNDVQARTNANASKSNILVGLNIGIGVRLSKYVYFNSQYNILGSTKFHTNLNNTELTLKVEY